MLRLSMPLSIVRIPHHSPGIPRGLPAVIVAEAAERSSAVPRRTRSALETRISLVLALASQASALSLRVLGDLASESAKYAFPRRFEARNLEEALMAVPDLETVRFRVVKRAEQYEIREVEPYYVAETYMPSKSGFDFNGASRAFNVLAAYLFGKNSGSEKMEMTTPVYTQKIPSKREKMDMTTPVITKQSSDEWHMSFVLPSKYGANLPLPEDPSVRIRQVPGRTMAVSAFSGFVTDENVKMRESKLRIALINDSEFQIKEDATIEVAQFNPPFTLPFTRRNEISLEVQRKMI
ncbi:Heme-binding-like protein [Apostasia shenzhenica]|uniref:Heme-binding-like protein n=1 Tax=Apostasia shenzhenica TaxID=1088818 RepID=A0A2I0BC78_9ASPA|nr:Heme-binding-like protein [Apostasia shenzhenica]